MVNNRKEKLRTLINKQNCILSSSKRKVLCNLLIKHHKAFSVEENERGKTDVVQLEIDTRDAPLQRQPSRRIPYAAQQELAHLLEDMQKSQVIQPSESPWASLIVLTRKEDGSFRLCVDYRALNSVTKADLFLLPRIADIPHQFGDYRYFRTLDLKSVYWQVKVHRNSPVFVINQ